MPIFALYKKYLKKNKPTERVSEIFTCRLHAEGESGKDRSNKGIFRKVYEELIEETPCELISRLAFLMCLSIMHYVANFLSS